MVNLVINILYTKLFVTKTVGEIMSGYDDDIMYLASILDSDLVKSSKFSVLNGVSQANTGKLN